MIGIKDTGVFRCSITVLIYVTVSTVYMHSIYSYTQFVNRIFKNIVSSTRYDQKKIKKQSIRNRNDLTVSDTL